MTVAGNLVPHEGYKYKLGTPDLKWIGHFSKLNVDTFSALTFENVVDCVYECRTLYLASSGVCDGEPTPCGYLDDDCGLTDGNVDRPLVFTGTYDA